MTVGAIITGLLWFALSRATSFGEFLAINGLFGICVEASTVIPCSLVIACVWRIADSGKISNSPQTGSKNPGSSPAIDRSILDSLTESTASRLREARSAIAAEAKLDETTKMHPSNATPRNCTERQRRPLAKPSRRICTLQSAAVTGGIYRALKRVFIGLEGNFRLPVKISCSLNATWSRLVPPDLDTVGSG